MKKEMRSTVIAAAAVLGCFVVGWCGARWAGGGLREGAARRAAVAGEPAQALAARAGAHGPGVAAREWGEALAKFGKEGSGMTEDHALVAALLRMEAADFPASAEGALEIMAEHSNLDPQRFALAEAWMGRWLELDAPAALRFLETSPVFGKMVSIQTAVEVFFLSQIKDGLSGIFTALARKQPEWLQKYLEGLPENSVRTMGMCALLRGIAQGDVEQARRLLAGMAKGKDRSAAVTGFVTELARTDMVAAFDLARAESSDDPQHERMKLVFSQAGPRSVAGVKALLDRIEDSEERRKIAMSALSTITFEKDADLLPFVKKELSWMVAVSGSKVDFDEWEHCLQEAGTKPQAYAFAEWALEFAPDKDGKMFRQLVLNWAAIYPEEFAAWACERAATLDAVQIGKLGAAIGGLTYDVAAAHKFWEALPAGPLRDQACFQVAMHAGINGDVSQAAEAYRSVAATDAKGTLSAQLAYVLVEKDGAAAAEWATQQPPGKARDEALRVIASQWSQRDVHGAAQWLETLPAGAERDQAVKTYATTVVVADAEAAAQWVGQVADPLLRQQTAEVVFARWRIQDPVAARAWLGGLPGGMLEKFMRNAE